MPKSLIRLLAAAVLASLATSHAQDAAPTELSKARAAWRSTVSLPSTHQGPAPTAPADVFRTLKFGSPVGALSAYLTPDPHDGRKHPAIIWITGGDCNSIGDVWSPAQPSNDQTAVQYRQAGIVMMFPSLRGGNDNPGAREAFYGETADILAAADFLAKQPYVDPARIYLGGHSTGGTMVLTTSEVTSRFRAVFAFGPVGQANVYGPDIMPVDFRKLDRREATLRWPQAWLDSIHARTIVIEGADRGNVSELREMEKVNHNPLVSFVPVPGATHFTVLAPANRLLASKILADTGPTVHIDVSAGEIEAAMR